MEETTNHCGAHTLHSLLVQLVFLKSFQRHVHPGISKGRAWTMCCVCVCVTAFELLFFGLTSSREILAMCKSREAGCLDGWVPAQHATAETPVVETSCQGRRDAVSPLTTDPSCWVSSQVDLPHCSTGEGFEHLVGCVVNNHGTHTQIPNSLTLKCTSNRIRSLEIY